VPSTSAALLAHIAQLKKQEAAKPAAAKVSSTVVYWGASDDKSFLHMLKPCMGGAPTLVRLEVPSTLSQIAMYALRSSVIRL